jgi:hypothetical protein
MQGIANSVIVLSPESTVVNSTLLDAHSYTKRYVYYIMNYNLS